MIKPFIFLLVLMLFQFPVGAQSPWKGTWEGKITTGASLRIGFHFSEAGDSLSVTMDSPDQGAYGLPVELTYLDSDSVVLSLKKFGISYRGKRSNDIINGWFIQGGMIPMLLKKVEKMQQPNRPQHPVPPFPYTSQSVSFKNHDITLSGTLTIPPGQSGQTYTTILLISGSGPQNRDEEIMGHRPFAVLADHLSRNGFMVLRVDDRGTGTSTGDFSTATSLDFASDASAAIDFLKTRPETNPNKIGMLGHSEGGMIAPLVAVSRDDINFLILLAAPGIKTTLLMRNQNEALLQANGISRLAQQAYGDLYLELVKAIQSSEGKETEAAETVIEKWAAGTAPEIVKELVLEHPSDQVKLVGDFTKVFTQPWYRYFMRYDPVPVLQKVKAKVLAINGDKDIQVGSAANLAGIKQGLAKTDVEIHELKGLNHLFQHCITCTVPEYGELEETMAPQLLSLVTDWLNRKVVNQ